MSSVGKVRTSSDESSEAAFISSRTDIFVVTQATRIRELEKLVPRLIAPEYSASSRVTE
jgi:hypothetical protein